MATTSAAATPSAADKAVKRIGIMLALIVLVMMFGAGRTLTAKQYLSATAGTTVETELIDISKHHSPTVDVVAQLQYTQQALYKAELISDDGSLIKESSQDVNSRRSESTKRLGIANWPDPKSVKVRITVASQSITATPPQGVTASQVPVIFEIKVYKQLLNRQFLWPAFWACLGLWIIAMLARRKDATGKPKEWV